MTDDLNTAELRELGVTGLHLFCAEYGLEGLLNSSEQDGFKTGYAYAKESQAAELSTLRAQIEALQRVISRVCDRVEKQTRVTESIIVRDAHPESKLSDGSHVIQTLNLHIHDAIGDARAAVSPKQTQ